MVQEKAENTVISGEGWTPLLFIVSLATTIGTAVPVGYCLGSLNTPAGFIKDWVLELYIQRHDFEFSENGLELVFASIVSIFLIGGIFGSFFGAYCCDKFGRKGCLNLSAALLVVSGVFVTFCREGKSLEMIFISRFLAGIASALIYTAHPMYLLEIAPPKLRGSVAVFTAFGVTAGICVGQIFSFNIVFGTEEYWQYALGFYAVFVIICFLPTYWYPESPRWRYLIKHQYDIAEKELVRLRGTGPEAQECVKSEIAEMQSASKSTEEKSSFLSVLRNSDLLMPLILVCSFQICQQLSGINAIFFYSVPIFTKAGFSSSAAEWMNFGAGFLNMTVSGLGPFLMSKFNRRPLMLISCVGCFISLICLAFALNYIDLANWLPPACIVFITTFITFFQLGLGPIPYFIGSELFEVKPRPVAMSMGSLFSWFGNFLIGMCFPILQGVWGAFVFLPCSIVCVYCFLLTYRYLPESRGRDAADIQVYMRNGFHSKLS
ncbi:solute carrier family 2, facilitated glucose transporter member 1-like isoform X2 [Teleopsis dalmanni]|uniref:solute carrier family 2, facilitated glucose transporter member 1-like isoform X2 n=1 Tax=Teleopsis dalmanni TaxID=139649 RepID=UPI0018CEA15E|nr:solute carrier family 2, facilitated glucose transporter member 1-like isoform X2 [Teleopsis dalmanni]